MAQLCSYNYELAHADGSGSRVPRSTVPSVLRRELRLNAEFRRVLWRANVLKVYLGRWAETSTDAAVDLGDVEVGLDGLVEHPDRPASPSFGPFETFYSADLDALTESLLNPAKSTTPAETAQKLLALRSAGLSQRRIDQQRTDRTILATYSPTPRSPNADRAALVAALVALGCSPPALCQADVEGMNLRAPADDLESEEVCSKQMASPPCFHTRTNTRSLAGRLRPRCQEHGDPQEGQERNSPVPLGGVHGQAHGHDTRPGRRPSRRREAGPQQTSPVPALLRRRKYGPQRPPQGGRAVAADYANTEREARGRV